MVHVPYRGAGQALTGLLGGEVQLLFSTLVQILPHVRDGRLKALAVTGERRSPLAPDVPTMVESGFDQLITTSVNVIVAPPGTPLAIRRQINQAAAAALASTELRQAFALLGYEARAASPEEVASYLAEAQHRWSRLIETARISID
jgi:tripartite-type tricarboxylate transporter receptor subunit TctC